MSGKRILLVGTSSMELSMNMYELPAAGATAIDDGGVAYTPGGHGANAAIAFKRLGAESIFCTKLGADLHGQKLYGYFKDAGLNTSYIKVDHDFPTGFSAILKEANADARTVYYPGANMHITRENLIDAFSSCPDALYLNFGVSFDIALTAAKMAAAKSVPIFIDASPADKNFPLEALPEIEIFSPNEAETLEYTGILPAGADSSLRAALTLYKRVKCKYVVIKQGTRGVFVYNGKHYQMIPPYRPDRVVDTAASGDAFTAALTLEYLKTGDVVRSVKYAAAVAAVTVSRPGASESLPTEAEVIDFIRKRPEQ